MRKKGKTDVWYFSEKGKFAGFATTINSDELILLDYLAVPEALQGRGIGAKMLESLKKAGVGEVIRKAYNSIAVNTDMLDCDYYRFLEGDARAVNSYRGEFMSSYSWAEFSAGALNRMFGLQ